MLGGHHPDPVAAGVGEDRLPAASSRTARSPGLPCWRARRWWPGRRRRRTAGAVAGHGVDVPGGHRLPVEGAGGGRDHPDPVVAGSAITRLPRASTATPCGPSSSALVAGRRRRRTRWCRCRRRCRCPRRSSPARRRCRSLAATTRTRLLPVVGDHQVPGAVHRHALRGRELGAGGRAPVAGEPPRPLPATV